MFVCARVAGLQLVVIIVGQRVSSIRPVELARPTHRTSSLTAMTATLMIESHTISGPTTYPHLSSRPAIPPTTSPMIMGPTSS